VVAWRRRRVVDWVADHPVAPLAVRAAVAAMTAWLVVLPFGGVADDYPYYAPLGAVASVSMSVTSTIRVSLHAFLAVGIGAVLGAGAHLVPLPAVLALGAVVALGIAVTAWVPLGAMASWVPISAIFVLIVGGDDPQRFLLAYLGLITVGALVGVAVNAAVPPLSIASAGRAQDSLRAALVEQLTDLARTLEQEVPPTSEEWQHHRWRLEAHAGEMQEVMARTREGLLVNWRVRRWREMADRQRRHARALTSLAFLVEDLAELVADGEYAEREQLALGPTLRPSAAGALSATAAALDSVRGSEAGGPELRRAQQATDDFEAAIRSVRRRTDQDQFAAGALLIGIRRTLGSVDPAVRLEPA
jgi:uncharacterized membrane protein YgaE (UPF0421/DUF939 family)